jgi:hypothetical protein
MIEIKSIKKDSGHVELFFNSKSIGIFNTPKLAQEYVSRHKLKVVEPEPVKPVEVAKTRRGRPRKSQE